MNGKGGLILIALLIGISAIVLFELSKRDQGFFADIIFVDQPEVKVEFDREKWAIKNDDGYPHRAAMLDDVIFHEGIRSLKKESLVEILGTPDRTNENHLYYLIDQKRIGFWPISTKTMVIKLSKEESIEWIKIHE